MPAIPLTAAEQAGVAAADTSLDTAFASGMNNPDTSANTPVLLGYAQAQFAGKPPVDRRAYARHPFRSAWVALVRALSSFVPSSTAVPGGSFLNSWTDGGGCAYYKDPLGHVYLEGFIGGGSLGSDAFQLPSGFRPLVTKVFAVCSNGAFGEVRVDTNGFVRPLVGATLGVSLDGINFRT
jgi:hypothetical protein